LNRRITYVAGAAIAAVAVAAVVVGVVMALSDESADGPSPRATSTVPSLPGAATRPPAGIAPGEPTPPSRSATVVSTLPAGGAPPTLAPATPPPAGSPPAGRVRVPAPINSAEVQVRDGTPRYVLAVNAGLPSGCARPDTFTVEQTGNEIKVSVYNTMPTGNPPCTAIYGTYDLAIDLGTNITSGQTYRIEVNGTRVTFTAR
jgi:hypothetical protein